MVSIHHLYRYYHTLTTESRSRAYYDSAATYTSRQVELTVFNVALLFTNCLYYLVCAFLLAAFLCCRFQLCNNTIKMNCIFEYIGW